MGYRKKGGVKEHSPLPPGPPGTCPLPGLLSGGTASRGRKKAMTMFQQRTMV
ncbi:hypothetical protein BREVNS_1419 [Brevinematales bacterium NS]|nr:hypothetical protein BREVNS_1419 [Brevinematales bacterium NS]